MDARIIDVTPPGGPKSLRIWQIETKPHPGGPWHQDRDGEHASADYDKLRRMIDANGWRFVD